MVQDNIFYFNFMLPVLPLLQEELLFFLLKDFGQLSCPGRPVQVFPLPFTFICPVAKLQTLLTPHMLLVCLPRKIRIA